MTETLTLVHHIAAGVLVVAVAGCIYVILSVQKKLATLAAEVDEFKADIEAFKKTIPSRRVTKHS